MENAKNATRGRRVLIGATALASLASGSVRIVDCRCTLADPDQGRRDFLEAHIPGAVYASLDRDLSDLSRPGLGRHPLPSAAAFSRTLSRWGVGVDQRVIVYDAAGGALAAARLWWMLRSVRVSAAVLDGGWRAWAGRGLPVEHGSGEVSSTAAAELHFDPTQAVTYDELETLRRDASALLLDARAPPRFRGESEPIDPVAGHVPGARNRPFSENLEADGCFKPAPDLQREFGRLLAGRDPHAVIHMCGSGVSACHNLLAMEVAGMSGSRLFAPSWSGWSSDPARPVATGD